jgi:hypothetical protein
MPESLDSLIATAAVILGLSLIVQAIQQIVKQTLDLKSTYMRAQLLALFGKNKPVSRLRANLLPITRIAKGAGPSAERIVSQLEDSLGSLGFPDLHLLEGLDATKVNDILRALPAASDKDAAVRGSVGDAITQVDRWFEISKKAFQEHYERRMKYWAFGLSAAVVIAMNADIFGIVQDFNTSRAMREAAVAAAPGLLETAQAQASAGGVLASDKEREAAIRQRAKVVEGLVTTKAFSIMRWNRTSGEEAGSSWGSLAAAGKTGLGWLVMTLLVSLGAPFWYDLLNAVMGLKQKAKG